ncbi:hypothetical protein CCACVL1_12015 [Corchorus capsularis]|uniref:Uncharacterized protein n=1 Tax=Corchorus capsularis TaxID=210143 RepID=A0A1R3II94_COCAP|nr:hypothetical protein CCACVL1_12015 [Corchorus capsularis]
MGNCLVLEDKVIKVMKTDGLQHLRPDAKLLGGQLYYLIPIPSPSQKSKKKKVRFSDPEVTDEQGSPAGVVRIKLVISKQELQELLQKEGVSVRDVVSQIQSKESTKAMDTSESDGGDDCRGWKPVLESIAEAN